MIYEFKIRRVRRSKAGEAGASVISPAHVAEVVRPFVKHEARECFLTLCLSSRNELLGIEITAIGGIASVEVSPREVFRTALLAGAAGIVMAHNHPSGDPMPSDNDRELTVRFMKAGSLLGIPVMDHVVVTETGHYSIREEIERSGEGDELILVIG